jgi:hypothetical protein
MSVSEIKEQLHLVIDSIEDEEFLEALLTITNSQQSKIDAQPSDEEIKILEEREARYRSGESKAIPWKKVQEEIKKKYGF